MKVIVAGAGNLGYFLATDLKGRGHDVMMIEQDKDIVDRAVREVPVTWIHGDACEPWVLEKAEVQSADVLVAATGDDEDNLVISLLAKQEFAVPRVVARVNHPKNEWLFNENWGVDVAVSTPHLILALTEEALSVGSLVRLLKLEHGRVALVEVTLPGDSPVVGKH